MTETELATASASAVSGVERGLWPAEATRRALHEVISDESAAAIIYMTCATNRDGARILQAASDAFCVKYGHRFIGVGGSCATCEAPQPKEKK